VRTPSARPGSPRCRGEIVTDKRRPGAAAVAREAHPPSSLATKTGRPLGGDFDCAVQGLDRLRPMRADKSWRLCQCLRYDLSGWYWVLEREGEVIAIDTLDDPRGIGHYGFPTRRLPRTRWLSAPWSHVLATGWCGRQHGGGFGRGSPPCPSRAVSSVGHRHQAQGSAALAAE
jgi:hypothetical protein